MFHAKFGVNYTPYRLQCGKPMDSLLSAGDRKKVEDAISILVDLRDWNRTSGSLREEQGGALQGSSNAEVYTGGRVEPSRVLRCPEARSKSSSHDSGLRSSSSGDESLFGLRAELGAPSSSERSALEPGGTSRYSGSVLAEHSLSGDGIF